MLALAIDWSAVRTQPNLEKRSDLALQYADSILDEARDQYKKGEFEKTKSSLGQVQEAVDLSYDSLLATGKDPRRSSGPFKRAEKATRELLRRLDGLHQAMSV